MNLSVNIFLHKLNSIYCLPKARNNFEFREKATVFECGNDFYSIIWETNFIGTGFITYKYNNKQYTIYDQRGGNIRTMDTIHTVKVPKKHLDNNTYRYHSQYILKKFDYSAIKGNTISSPEITFKGYNNESEINALVLSDIHGDYESAKKAVDYFDTSYNLLIMNGDISSSIVYKSDFTRKVLRFSYLFSKGEIPVAYTRGNHETRGEFSSEVPLYFHTPGDGLYFDFSYGPFYFLVLDTGEDKPDNHIEYSGLVDFQNYIDNETEWLKKLKPDYNENIVLKTVFAHQPCLDNRYSNNWCKELERLNITTVISGHTHTFELDPAYNTEYSFKTIIEGGYSETNGYIASMFTFSNDGTLKLTAYDLTGNLIAEEKIVNCQTKCNTF